MGLCNEERIEKLHNGLFWMNHDIKEAIQTVKCECRGDSYDAKQYLGYFTELKNRMEAIMGKMISHYTTSSSYWLIGGDDFYKQMVADKHRIADSQHINDDLTPNDGFFIFNDGKEEKGESDTNTEGYWERTMGLDKFFSILGREAHIMYLGQFWKIFGRSEFINYAMNRYEDNLFDHVKSDINGLFAFMWLNRGELSGVGTEHFQSNEALIIGKYRVFRYYLGKHFKGKPYGYKSDRVQLEVIDKVWAMNKFQIAKQIDLMEREEYEKSEESRKKYSGEDAKQVSKLKGAAFVDVNNVRESHLAARRARNKKVVTPPTPPKNTKKK